MRKLISISGFWRLFSVTTLGVITSCAPKQERAVNISFRFSNEHEELAADHRALGTTPPTVVDSALPSDYCYVIQVNGSTFSKGSLMQSSESWSATSCAGSRDIGKLYGFYQLNDVAEITVPVGEPIHYELIGIAKSKVPGGVCGGRVEFRKSEESALPSYIATKTIGQPEILIDGVSLGIAARPMVFAAGTYTIPSTDASTAHEVILTKKISSLGFAGVPYGCNSERLDSSTRAFHKNVTSPALVDKIASGLMTVGGTVTCPRGVEAIRISDASSYSLNAGFTCSSANGSVLQSTFSTVCTNGEASLNSLSISSTLKNCLQELALDPNFNVAVDAEVNIELFKSADSAPTDLLGTVSNVPVEFARPSALSLVTSGSDARIKLVAPANVNRLRFFSDVTCSTGVQTSNVPTGQDPSDYLSTIGILLSGFSVANPLFAKYSDVTDTEGLCAYVNDSVPLTIVTATLSGVPTAPTNASTVNITVGGSGLLNYKHKIGPTAAGFCQSATGYSAPASYITPITDNITVLSDGSVSVCVVGQNSSGVWQSYSNASEATFIRDTTAPLNATSLAWQYSSPSNIINQGVTWTKSTSTDLASQVTAAYSDVGCTTLVSSTQTLSNTAGSDTVTLPSTGTSYFGVKSIDNAGNQSMACSSAIVIDTTAPSAASALTFTQISPSNATTFQINWTVSASGDVASQTIFIYPQVGCTGTPATQNLSAVANTTTFLPVDGITYSFYVRSIDAAANQVTSACSSSLTSDMSAPTLASVSITNSSPTSSTLYGLSFGATTGSPTKFCILENDTTVGNCSWVTASLPASFTVSGAQNAKTLSIWVQDNAGNVSTRVDSNSVTLDTTAPTLAAASVTNTSPTGTTMYSLSFGSITGTYTQYCILENNTVMAGCSWISATLPATFTVSGVNNAKTLSVWLKDAAGNTSTRVDTNAVTLVTTVAVLTISDTDPYDFGSVTQGATATHTFIVSNSGPGAASSVTAGGLAAPYVITSDTCAGSVPASPATCSIVVTFSPTATGFTSDQIQISYYDGVAPQTATRDIQGSGVTPAVLTISDIGFDYGVVTVGATVSKTFTITNTGGTTATALSPTGLAAPYTVTGGDCGGTLAAGGAFCTIIVSFSPGSTGSQPDQLDLSYNDGVSGTSVSRAIGGTGATPALLSISNGPNYDFGSAVGGDSLNHTFTITNSGQSTATTIAIAGLAAPFVNMGGTCGATLAGGNDCDITINFQPVTSGPFYDTIAISYFDGNVTTGPVNRSIMGTGIGPTPGFTNLPISPSNTTVLNISVNGSSVAQYKYKLTNLGSGDCTSGSGYSGPVPVATPVTDNISAMPEGTIYFCVIGASSTGAWQDYGSAIFGSWTKDTAAPLSFNITGVMGNSVDSSIDNLLEVDSLPEPHWNPSSGASMYDVTILENDAVTVVCPLMSVASYSHLFNICPLNPGNFYRVRVRAFDMAGNWVDASNNFFQFAALAPGIGTWTWNSTNLTGLPTARRNASAVYTGTEVLIWGGRNNAAAPFSSGGRYNPSTDTWSSMQSSSQPAARYANVVQWNGTDMLIWGGKDASTVYSDGRKYNPASDTWTTMATPGIAARANASSAISGNSMLVWGGTDFAGTTYQATGSIYDSAGDTWTAITGTGLSARAGAAIVSYGGEFFVFFGYNASGPLGDYKKINSSGAWTLYSPSGSAPSPRRDFAYALIGSEFYVYGGMGTSGRLNDAYKLNLSTNTWTALPSPPSLTPRDFVQGTSISGKFFVWGGYDGTDYVNSGAFFDPGVVDWVPMNPINAPTGRIDFSMLGLSSSIFVWGGLGSGVTVTNTGGRLEP